VVLTRQPTGENTTPRTHLVCWIPKAKNTNSQYVILIAFPIQQ